MLSVLYLQLAAGLAGAQAPTGVTVRGRVTGPDSTPIVGALVVARAAAEGTAADSARSTAGGAYAVRTAGNRAVALTASAPGFAERRATFTLGTRDTTVDLRLARSTAAALDTVRVRAQRAARPPVTDPAGGPPGDARATGRYGLTPAERGDLAAIAASVPGVVLGVAGGFSVFGQDPSANNVTLGGVAFAGSAIPRAAAATVTLNTTSYDPASGGFSGGLLSVDLTPGSAFALGTLTAVVDDPALQYAPAAGAQLGAERRNVQVSAGRVGPLARDALYYNVSAEVGRRTSPAPSVLAAGGDALAALGLSEETRARFASTLASLGIPAALGGAGSRAATHSASAQLRLDWRPAATQGSRATTLTAGGGWSRSSPAGLLPTDVPARAGRATTWSGNAALAHARHVGDRFTGRFRAGGSVVADRGSPFVRLPEARVLVASELADGRPGLGTVRFGGAGGLPAGRRVGVAEAGADLSWHTPGARHRPRLTAGARLDAAAADPPYNPLGAFAFASLDDLAAGRPASFARTLSGGATSSRGLTAFVSAGDVWRPRGDVTVTYGVRAEGSDPGVRAAYNPLVDSLFGLRTDRAPRSAAVSPRLGITWRVAPRFRAPKGGVVVGDGWGTVRGGVGEYRSVIPASLLADAAAATGLPGALRGVTCLGPAAPTPDWAAYLRDASRVPAACLGQGAPLVPVGAPFADGRPAVTVVGRGFAPAASRRAELGWTRAVAFHYEVGVQGVWSAERASRSAVDRNFAGAAAFTLADEGRAVFVPVARVDPATGAADAQAASRFGAVGRVEELRSDLRGGARQLNLTFRQDGARPSPLTWTLGYSLTDAWRERRGFDGGAFGDPRLVERGAGGVPRHAFFLRGALDVDRWRTYVALYGRVQSGLPYTPLVRGDANGDGLVGDRAFVYGPGEAPDARLAEGMRDLLATTSPNARECLERQRGRAAGLASCRGPWSATLNVLASVEGAALGLPNRSAIDIHVLNPLAGVDRLAHGARGLRGWGAVAAPDPTLLVVDGFDPAARRFRYRVNPTFGDVSPARTALRAPFQVTLEVTLPLQGPLGRQRVSAILAPGRGAAGTRPTAAALARRLKGSAGVSNPAAELLEWRDSVDLTATQVRALETISRRFDAVADSVWGPVAADLAALPNGYDERAVTRRVGEGVRATYVAAAVASAGARVVFTPDQIDRLSPYARALLHPRTWRVGLRTFLGDFGIR